MASLSLVKVPASPTLSLAKPYLPPVTESCADLSDVMAALATMDRGIIRDALMAHMDRAGLSVPGFARILGVPRTYLRDLLATA